MGDFLSAGLNTAPMDRMKRKVATSYFFMDYILLKMTMQHDKNTFVVPLQNCDGKLCEP